MLEIYRFILALCVVQGHLLVPGIPWLSWQAVFSFYVIAGFLMTKVLNENYGFTAFGFGRFILNRVLRLFPCYLIVIGLTLAYIYNLGPLNQLNAVIRPPQTATQWIENLSIIGLSSFEFANQPDVRLIPPAWSLAIEWFCYVLLALGAARNRATLTAMLAVGLAISAFYLIRDFDRPDFNFQDRYGVYQAGLIPFALGGLAYFWRDHPLLAFSWRKLWWFALLMIVNAALGFWPFHRYVTGLYVAIALNVFLVPMMFARPVDRRWAQTCGGIAYPIFVSHWLIGTLVAIYLPAIPRFGAEFVLIATALTVAFSVLLYLGIDRRIDRMRTVVRRWKPATALA